MFSLEWDDSGFKEFSRRLQSLGGEVPLEQIFAPSFMQSRTRFADIGAMYAASPFAGQEAETVVGTPEWNAYVRETTIFDSWDAMLQEGVSDYTKRHLSGE